MAAREEGLSEDDEVFSGSGDESGSGSESGSSGAESGSAGSSGSESEAAFTDEEPQPRAGRKRGKKGGDATRRDSGSDESDAEGRRKRRRRDGSRFVETEAAVGDAPSDDEEEDEDDDDFVDTQIEERDREFSAAFRKRLEAHASRRAAEAAAFAEAAPEAIEARLRARHAADAAAATQRAGPGTLKDALAGLAPAGDARLFLVRCRAGSERAAVAGLAHHAATCASLGRPESRMRSVLSRDSLRGYVYVEARSGADVAAVVKDARMTHLLFAAGANAPAAVPASEMAAVLSFAPKAAAASAALPPVGAWVRIRRGKYAGDAARVVGHEGDDGVRICVVPRLSVLSPGAARPAPRLFDASAVAAAGGSVARARGAWMYAGDEYRDGLLVKTLRASAVDGACDPPGSDERAPFAAFLGEAASSGADGAGRPAAGSDAQTERSRIAAGEALVVTEGEFRGVRAQALAAEDAGGVFVRLADGVADPLVIPARALRRDIPIGAAVVDPATGRAGTLVALDGDSGVVYSEASGTQFSLPLIRLRPADARHGAAARSRASAALAVHALVVAEGRGPGVVLRVLPDERHAAVLCVDGETRVLSAEVLQAVAPAGPAAGRGAGGFRPGDRIDVLEADGSRLPATVLHVSQPHVFVRPVGSPDVLVRPLGAIAKPVSMLAAGGGAPPQHGHGSAPLRRDLIGRTVTITGAGPHKGYVGIVRDVDAASASVELHTNCRVVSVPLARVTGGAGYAAAGAVDGPAGASLGSRTPGWGAGGKTPAWGAGAGGKTPAWGANAGGKTPAWGASAGGKTPAWGASAGGKTPAWGANAGGKTPAWAPANAGGKTPAWGAPSTSDGRTPAWGAAQPGGKTPAWGAAQPGGKTPAWGAANPGGKTPAWGPAAPANSATTPGWGAHHAGHSAPVRPPVSAQPSSSSGAASWALPGTLVVHNGAPAAVESVGPDGALRLSGRTEAVRPETVDRPPVAKRDRVRLLGAEATGTVIGLDGPDAVVRVDGTSDFRIVSVAQLSKLAG